MSLVSSLFAKNPVEQKIPLKEILAEFTDYAVQTQADWHVPGMAIAIVKGDQIIYVRGFGKRTTEDDPVTPDTIFDIASLTKSFTATLLAMQIDEGKYAWNSKIVKLYPKFKLYDPNTTKEFEVQDLMAHDSGLPEGTLSAMGSFGYSIDHALYALRFIKPIAPFRSEFAYQNIFPMLAGEIIQKLSGKSYTDNLHQRLFSRLQMNHSYTEYEEKLYRLKDVAQPFDFISGQEYAYPIHSSYSSKLRASEKAAGSSGGIHSSATDIAKWLIFNINNGAIGDTQLVTVKNMNFIHSPVTFIKDATPESKTKENTQNISGQGWFIDKQRYRPYTLLYHAGGGTGMHALMAYIPDEKIGIVVLTNTWGNKVPEALYQRFFDLYMNKNPLKNWSKIYLQEQAATEAGNNAKVKPDQCQMIENPNLEKYIGTYYNRVFGNLKVTKQGDHLNLTIGPIGVVWKLTYCNDNIMRAYWPNPYGLNFAMLSNGQNLIEFTTEPKNAIQKMTVPYLNSNGYGVFIKK